MSDAMIAEPVNPIDTPSLPAGAADKDWSQYLTFTADNLHYGVEITTVREIRGWSEPTKLPNAPKAMRGVLNLRGVVVPVFDLRYRLGRGTTEVTATHAIVVVMIGERMAGIVVDTVSDILTLEPGDILAVPDMGNGLDQEALTGLVSRADKMIALLKLEQLFDLSDGGPASSI